MRLEYIYVFKDDFILIFPIQIQDYRVYRTSLILHLYLLSSTLRILVLKESEDELEYLDLICFFTVYIE